MAFILAASPLTTEPSPQPWGSFSASQGQHVYVLSGWVMQPGMIKDMDSRIRPENVAQLLMCLPCIHEPQGSKSDYTGSHARYLH